MKNLIPYDMWCGTEASYHAYLASIERFDTFMKDKSEDDFMKPAVPYTKVGNVGVIQIKGALVPGEVPNIVADWFGVMGYDNLKYAGMQALADKDVKRVHLQIESGGGAVSGLKETADFFAELGLAKPLSSHTNDIMASAAYWLGSTASRVSAGEMARVGSIGVLATHTEVSEKRKQEGYTDTVFRAGKYKALGHPLEKLSQDGSDTIQAEIDYMYGKFLTAVSENRGRSVDTVDTVMGQGRVFLGEQALAVGLVDAVETAQEAFAHTNGTPKRAKVAASVTNLDPLASATADNSASQPTEDEHMKLTEAQKQALAAGASIESVLAASAEAPSDEGAAAEAGAGAGTEDATETVDVAQLQQALADAQTELASAQAELASVKTVSASTASALEAASDEVAVQKTAADALATIVSGITNHMNIALGRSKVAYASTDAAQAYATVLAEFKAKFPVGGVAADSSKRETVVQLLVPPREWEAAKNLFKSK